MYLELKFRYGTITIEPRDYDRTTNILKVTLTRLHWEKFIKM